MSLSPGPSRGTKIWGCTVVKRLYLEKISRDFHNLFFQKTGGARAPCAPPLPTGLILFGEGGLTLLFDISHIYRFSPNIIISCRIQTIKYNLQIILNKEICSSNLCYRRIFDKIHCISLLISYSFSKDIQSKKRRQFFFQIKKTFWNISFR